MNNAAFLGIFLAFGAACIRTAPSGRAALSPALRAAAVVSVDAGAVPSVQVHGPHAVESAFAWAFWTGDGALVAASNTDIFKLAPSCAVPLRTPAAVSALFARNGTDTFVVEREGAFSLWSAATLKEVAPIEHPGRGRGGAIAPGGARVALGGCKEIAIDPKLLTNCGEIYDGATGRHLAGFVGAHPIEDFAFTADGRYLVARSGSSGLSVFDAETGRAVVARPRWKRVLEVHGWNRADVAEILGDDLIITHGDSLEHIDLATGKTLGQARVPERTVAVYGPRMNRVAALVGTPAKALVWDVATHAFLRTFDVSKFIASEADCTHCALEFDDLDEDQVWMTSAYTYDRLSLRVGTGAIERVEHHVLRSDAAASSTHRIDEGFDTSAHSATCSLVRRAEGELAQHLPVTYCNRRGRPSPHDGGEWPYPGFNPKGNYLASIDRGELNLWSVDRGETVCTAGKRDEDKPKKIQRSKKER
jgi:hypothetical protein